jgi:hypothetical protein
MGKAAVGTSVGTGRTGRMLLALSAAVLVVVMITLATLLFTAAPPVAPASSGGVGETPPAVGVGGEHYGEGWTNYGHALGQPNPVR